MSRDDKTAFTTYRLHDRLDRLKPILLGIHGAGKEADVQVPRHKVRVGDIEFIEESVCLVESSRGLGGLTVADSDRRVDRRVGARRSGVVVNLAVVAGGRVERGGGLVSHGEYRDVQEISG